MVCSLPADVVEQSHVLDMALVEALGGVFVSAREDESEIADAHEVANQVIPERIAFFSADLHGHARYWPVVSVGRSCSSSKHSIRTMTLSQQGSQ